MAEEKEPMEPMKALSILEQASGAAKLSRGDHILVEEALLFLKTFIEDYGKARVEVLND